MVGGSLVGGALIDVATVGTASAAPGPALGSVIDFARGPAPASASTVYDLSAQSGGTPTIAGDPAPFTDPMSRQEQVFGISTGGDLFVVVRNVQTLSTGVVDLTSKTPGLPPLVGNPAPFIDPQTGAEQILARARNGDVIDVARSLDGSAFGAYDLTGSGASKLAGNPVPFVDPQTHQEQIFGTSTGGHLFELWRDAGNFSVHLYDISAASGTPSPLQADPAPIVDPQTGAEQIDVGGVNGDIIDYSRDSHSFAVGVYDLTRGAPGTPALAGSPVPFTDPGNRQEQIFGISNTGHVFEIYRNTATFAVAPYDLSAATAGAPATGRPAPFVDPQTGLEQIFATTASNGHVAVMNRSATSALFQADLTATAGYGQPIVGSPHPFTDPQTGSEQALGRFGVAPAPVLGPSVAAVALSQVGVGDSPSSTSFSFDCNPYTAMLYSGYSQAGCGRDPTFNVQDENLLWCADFAKWVWEQVGVTSDLATLTPSAASFYAWGARMGESMPADSANPEVGDAMIFYPAGTAGSAYADHVGIVVGVNTNGTVDLVNGDFNSATGIRVQQDVDVSPGPYAAAIWGPGEQWVYVAP